MIYGLHIHLKHPTGGGFGVLHTYSPANHYKGYEWDADTGTLVVYFDDEACGTTSKTFPLHNVLMVEEFVIDGEAK
jgi:hypothetical protein